MWVREAEVSTAVLASILSCLTFEVFLTEDTLSCHCRKSTGVTNNTNNGSAVFRKQDSITVNQHAQY